MRVPNGFDLELALQLAGLCGDAYNQYNFYKRGQIWPGPDGYKLEKTFNAVYENRDMPLGFIASRGDDVYVSWRGTSSVKEWIEDAKVEQVKCAFLADSNVDVELGFHQLYTTGPNGSSPRSEVLNYLKDRKINGMIYVTGHSLGSALSVLNILDIAVNTSHKKIALYTFAGPRTGSPEYASIYNSVIVDSWRVVNVNDEVPKLPFKNSLGYHYKHVEKEFDITFGGAMPWHWGDDHSLSNYISQLKKMKSA